MIVSTLLEHITHILNIGATKGISYPEMDKKYFLEQANCPILIQLLQEQVQIDGFDNSLPKDTKVPIVAYLFLYNKKYVYNTVIKVSTKRNNLTLFGDIQAKLACMVFVLLASNISDLDLEKERDIIYEILGEYDGMLAAEALYLYAIEDIPDKNYKWRSINEGDTIRCVHL